MTERCPCDCSKLEPFTEEEAATALGRLNYVLEGGVWRRLGVFEFAPEIRALQAGMNEELEHCDITGGDPIMTARIALAHLKEDPLYYEKLARAIRGVEPR